MKSYLDPIGGWGVKVVGCSFKITPGCFWGVELLRYMAYRACFVIFMDVVWYTSGVYLRRYPEWCTILVYLGGILLWYTFGVYLGGILLWYTKVVYIGGIPNWVPFKVYLLGSHWWVPIRYTFWVLTFYTL